MIFRFGLLFLVIASLCDAELEIHGQRVDVVLSGRDIPKEDTWSQSDPFIKVYFKFNSDSSYISFGQTNPSQDNPNPDWPQSFTFDFTAGGTQQIKFELWDEDVSFHDHIGDVELSLATLVAEANAASDGRVTRTYQTINRGTLIIKTRVGDPVKGKLSELLLPSSSSLMKVIPK